ncbi:MAG: efflux RND transporter permease subunit, partial [Duncaniella sp.]|nr:efflux RND transporter permease subunit [Duncaniella sp.]
QRISLGAFSVAMGLLGDNAVVIMDGILVDRKRGLTPDKYLYNIGRRTAMPLLGATVIASATFVAIYLSPDSAGEYAGDLFLVLCVSLLASWVLALVQVPVCAAAWLSKKEKDEEKKEGGDAKVMNSPAHRFIRRSVTKLIEYKWLTIGAAVALLIVCGVSMVKVKNLFFPDFDYRQFVVECYFPAQSTPTYVRDEMLAMSDTVMSEPKVERVAMSMGAAPARYCLVRPMSSGGDPYAELIVDCKDFKTVTEVIPGLLKRLRKLWPDAYIRIRKYNFSISSSHTVEVEFAGPDPAVLKRLSAEAEAVMRACPYVDPYSVQNNWRPQGKTIVADYDHASGVRAGISRSDIGNALQAATDGMTVGVIPDQDKMMLVNLRVRNADGSLIEDPRDIPVWSMTNVRLDQGAVTQALSGGDPSALTDKMFHAVPLGSVSPDMTLGWEEQTVRRLNGRRVIEAECDPNPYNPDATPAKVVQEIKSGIEAIKLPAGYTMRWVGEGELQADAITNLLKYIPITAFIIIVI